VEQAAITDGNKSTGLFDHGVAGSNFRSRYLNHLTVTPVGDNARKKIEQVLNGTPASTDCPRVVGV
jgi:hypothetical protein